MKPIDEFYLKLNEPIKSVLLALRKVIISSDSHISDAMKYGMPFFSYKNKMFCYFWIDKKTNEPYIGMVEGNRIEHPNLEKGNRSRMKILRISSKEDLPLETIHDIINQALDLYRNGIIKTK